MKWSDLREYELRRLLIIFLFVVIGVNAAEKSEASNSLLDNKYFLNGDHDGQLKFWLDSALKSPKDSLLPLILAWDVNTKYLADSQTGKELLQNILKTSNMPADSLYMARKQLGKILTNSGEYEKASAVFFKLGLIRKWRIAGPMGRSEKAAFYREFSPEFGIDFSATMDGLAAHTYWRVIPEMAIGDMIYPWDWVSPRRGVVYLYTQFKLTKAQEVIFDVDSSCSLSIWVDGKKQAAVERMRRNYPQHLSLNEKNNKSLSSGWHTLLIKMYAPYGEKNIAVRLLGADRKPIENVEYNISQVKEVRGENTFVLNTDPFKLESQLTAKMKKSSSAENIAKLAVYYQSCGLIDKAIDYWKQTVVKDSKNAAYLARMAMAGELAGFMPPPMRKSFSHQANLKAVSLNPNCVPSLYALGEYERGQGKLKEATEYYQQALKANPEALRILAARARMAIANKWRIESEEYLRAYKKVYPRSPLLYVLYSMQKNAEELTNNSAANLLKAYMLERGNINLCKDAASAAFSGGDIEEGLRVLSLLPQWYQEQPLILVLRGEMMARLKRYSQAQELFAKVVNILGEDASVLKLQAETYFLAGQKEKSLEFYKKSLQSSPEQHNIRRLIAELEGKDYAFWKEYSIPAEKALEEFEATKTPSGRAARLIDQTVINIYKDGSFANYTHELVSVLTESGVSQAAVVDSYGELLAARTILPENGVSLEPVILPGERNITMPAVAPGAAIEHKYLQEQRAPADKCLRFPSWYFRSPEAEESFILSQYIVRVPVGASFAYATRNLGNNVKFIKETDESGADIYIWTGRNMPRPYHEEGSPAINVTLPFVSISGKRSWQDVNRIFVNYYLGRCIPDVAIKKMAEELTVGLESSAEKIKVIFEYVCANVEQTTSKVSASHVFAQRSGDRNLLLLSMLGAVGIEAVFTPVRASDNILFAPEWSLPESSVFTNYLIAAKNEQDQIIWLDSRFRYGAAGVVGEDLAGGSAFLSTVDGGEFVQLPAPRYKDILLSEKKRYTPQDNTDIKITGETSIAGNAGYDLKESFLQASKKTQTESVEQLLSSALPGVEIEKYTLPGVEQAGVAFKVNFTANQPLAVKENRNGARGIKLGLLPLELLPEKDFSNRKTPFQLNRFLVGKDEIMIDLPAGSVVQSLPSAVTLRTDFGFYHLFIQKQNGGVLIKRSYDFRPQIIPVRDWSEYFKLARQIEEIESVMVWYKK